MHNCAYVSYDIFVTNSCPAQCRQIAAVPKDEYMNKKHKIKPAFRQRHKIQDSYNTHLKF